MRILFLSRWYPYPPDNGSRIRIYNLIKVLSRQHQIDLISFAENHQGDANHASAGLNGFVDQVIVVPYRPFQPDRWSALQGYFSRFPRSLVDTYSDEIESNLADRLRTRTYQAVIAFEIDMAPYLHLIQGPCRILEELELASQFEKYTKSAPGYKKVRAGLTWWKLAGYVTNLRAYLDGYTVVSEQEQRLSANLLGEAFPSRIIPNGVDIDRYDGTYGSPEADSLVYSGALTYQANFDAILYFLTEIFPLIQSQIPQARLYITGALTGVPLDRLPANPGVVYTGYLDDVRPRIARSWVSVVPLRVGGGTRLKILESLALGTPVVATSKGAQGLDLKPGSDLIIADQPQVFAQSVVRILKHRSLRDRLGTHGRKTVESRYNWDGIGQKLNQFIGHLVQEKAGAASYGADR